MYLHIANKLNLIFSDSLNFHSIKLAKIQEASGLGELSKVFFPHFLLVEKTTRCIKVPIPLWNSMATISRHQEREGSKPHCMQVKVSKSLIFKMRCSSKVAPTSITMKRGCKAVRNTSFNPQQ